MIESQRPEDIEENKRKQRVAEFIVFELEEMLRSVRATASPDLLTNLERAREEAIRVAARYATRRVH